MAILASFIVYHYQFDRIGKKNFNWKANSREIKKSQWTCPWDKLSQHDTSCPLSGLVLAKSSSSSFALQGI